ncbi:DJ-1/PfpI family protein [Fusibacter bizertensis]
MYLVNIILFEGFETLDVFGPVEIFGHFADVFQLKFLSLSGGLINSTQGVKVETEIWSPTDVLRNNVNQVKAQIPEILFIPGGQGTRREVENPNFIMHLISAHNKAAYTLSVCTGSALLARAGILDGHSATTNKRAFNWVVSQSSKTNWIREARWVEDGQLFTSSGVSAGMDMTLGFIAHLLGEEAAIGCSMRIEYHWQSDSTKDQFAQLYND